MKKIIVALDMQDSKKALELVKALSPYVDIFKVGPILFLTSGPKIIEDIKRLGNDAFLDMKFHDIPATVKRSVESARQMGMHSLTLHSAGGELMMKEAASVPNHPKLWAVTVLTSELTDPIIVRQRAQLAQKCGMDGVISSPHEIEIIKKSCGRDFTVVTPGIRMESDSKNDQKRISTPKAAIKAGADFIVVGRPIIEANDPVEAAKRINGEVEEALG
ncbi:MAG: orotidine-5'-phosphate decarboxylase [Endomicrobiales bacterium]|nr:orotidine-5'-phosphate decarboxylase [Endomicrobiales bacterium]